MKNQIKLDSRKIPEKDLQIVWGINRWKCMFRHLDFVCNEKLVKKWAGLNNLYHIWENAHIEPFSKIWPRSKWWKWDNTYKNLLVLCPTHHTIIDKDEITYTKEILIWMQKIVFEEYEKVEEEKISIAEISWKKIEK